ncbi:alpha/beta fold hydrolase [Kineobactrum salinum]|uniref:Alpha/beta hydrolase n=1 Tax=Kineobactrum salinum TaxID=2708301 RepID=A0A6C0TZ43_9GAMM|nr:alpha/beta hydrolase [Kineobactrum salinum]QIB65046.1 alpha/beta hydrolase [Kineobactrum salinum]
MNNDQLEHYKVPPLDIAVRLVGIGPPLIMFHGAEGDHRIYDNLQDALGSSVTAVSFDQRDCGRTEYTGLAQPYTLKDVAYDAVRLMDVLGYRKAHVLGNSIGGILAQLMACHWPERVDRLVLGLTWPADERLPDLNPEGLAKRAEYSAMGEAGLRPMAELMSSADYVSAHPEILKELAELSSGQEAEARERRMAALSVPSLADPGSIPHKTLVIGGEDDQMVPVDVTRQLASKIPLSEFKVLKGAGHLAARQYPGELASMIADFLNA